MTKTTYKTKKYITKTLIRIAGKLIDIAALVGIGSLFGFHLVRGF